MPMSVGGESGRDAAALAAGGKLRGFDGDVLRGGSSAGTPCIVEVEVEIEGLPSGA